MTQLSKLALLGIAKETTLGTYLAPTSFIPFSKCDYEDVFASIKDESYRGNDSGIQGIYQGVSEADWSIDLFAYPEVMGHFLRGIIGPDTVTPGATTTVGASSSIGATTITVASGTGLVAGLALKVGSGATSEYAQVGVGYTTGTSVPVVGGGAGGGLLYAHTTSDAVVAASTHVFKQSINPSDRATYSITIFDTLTTVGYSGAALSDLDIKIDPKSAVTLSSKFKSFQGVPQSSMTPAYTARPPILGWQWLMTNAGASSTRGTSYDLKIKRKIDVIHSSDGIQSPREIFQGALDVDGSYKAIYENQTDLNLFLQYIQTPVTATLQQPVAAGGSSLTLTTSKSGFTKGKREWQTYVEASFSLSGIYNSTDAGILTATLTNFQSTAY